MALGRGRHGERAARAEEHAVVVEPMDLRGIGEDAALAVEDDRVVLPRVPVAEHRFHELVGAVVAGVVLGMARPAEVGRLGVVERRDHVPGRAAADHVVERREDAGHVKRLVVRRRVGAADAEMTRGQPHRGEERDQVELDHADAVAHGFGMVVAVAVGHGQAVVEEGEVELARLERARDALVVVGGEEVLCRGRMPPRGRVVRAVLGLEKGHHRHLAVCARRHRALEPRSG